MIDPILVLGISLLCLCLPFTGLCVLLAYFVLGDRQAAHTLITIAGIPVYIGEASLGALLIRMLITAYAQKTPLLRSLSFSWKGLYTMSALSFLRGSLVYPPLQVVRDAALIYYSLFTHITREIFRVHEKRIRILALTLGAATILKAVLSYTDALFFFQEGSAASLYSVCVLVAGFVTQPLWERWGKVGYPLLVFLSYQIASYMFRSGWAGLAAGTAFYLLAGLMLHIPRRYFVRMGLVYGTTFLLILVFPVRYERYQKPIGQTNHLQTVDILQTELLSKMEPLLTNVQPLISAKPSSEFALQGTPPLSPTHKQDQRNMVLTQFRSLSAGLDSRNVDTRIWLWTDLLEDFFSFRTSFFAGIRSDIRLIDHSDREALESRIGPVILDSEISPGFSRTMAIGSRPLKILIGVPFGKKFIPQRVFYWMTETHRYDPHNSFLSVLYRLGVIGFILFFAVLSKELWASWRSLRALPETTRLYILALMTCVIAFCGEAFFSVSLENVFKGIFFWVFLGMLQSLRPAARHE